MKTVLTTALVLLIVVCLNSADAQDVGDQAPDFSFTSLNGSQLSLSQFRGTTVFLFLFGNQCPFCLSVGNRTETEVNAVFAPSGKFQALGLDLWDNSSSTSTVQAFKNQTGVTYPLLLHAGSIASTYSTTYDRVIVVDANGVIRFKGNSQVSNTLNDAKSVIESLIGGSTDVTGEPGLDLFALHQNFPNPFGYATSISYSLESSRHFTLAVYDVLGSLVKLLVDGPQPTEVQIVEWDGRDQAGRPVASGIYFYSLRSEGTARSRAMTLVR